MFMKKRNIAFLIMFAMILTACGGRLPNPLRSQHIIEHFFKRYTKKYPDTIYGQNRVTKVEVTNQMEIHKKFATVEAYITLGDGSLRKINATVEKESFGWRFISWEDATGL